MYLFSSDVKSVADLEKRKHMHSFDAFAKLLYTLKLVSPT